jgi:hypothetical protein
MSKRKTSTSFPHTDRVLYERENLAWHYDVKVYAVDGRDNEAVLELYQNQQDRVTHRAYVTVYPGAREINEALWLNEALNMLAVT